MESLERSFSEIKQIDRNGITFISGETIVFRECVKQRYNSETCVAERDLFAQPPYFLFFTPDKPTKVIFNKKGLCSKPVTGRISGNCKKRSLNLDIHHTI